MNDLVCENDESFLIDKIVLVNEKMSFDNAEEHCKTELNGQLWGDIDAPREELAVSFTVAYSWNRRGHLRNWMSDSLINIFAHISDS